MAFTGGRKKERKKGILIFHCTSTEAPEIKKNHNLIDLCKKVKKKKIMVEIDSRDSRVIGFNLQTQAKQSFDPVLVFVKRIRLLT